MLNNTLRSVPRHLARHKLYACINILGLAVGLSVFVLIMLYVEREYSYDRHWQDAGRIHWLRHERQMNASTFVNTVVPYPALDAVRDYFPASFDAAARLMSRTGSMHTAEQTFPEDYIQLAEPEFLQIFDLEVLAGSLERTMSAPGRIALSEERASRYFGERDPLGETLGFEVAGQGRLDYEVSAVFRVPPESSFELATLGLLQESSLQELAENPINWNGSMLVMSFFLLKPDVDLERINAGFADFVDQNVPRESWRVLEADQRLSDFQRYALNPLTDAHFDDSLRVRNGGNEASVLAFGLVGALVLLMAGTNFVILSTARAEEYRREIGIRKVLGASKPQLVRRFLGESVLYSLASLPLAAALVHFGLPFFEGIVNQELTFDLLNPATPAWLLLLALALGLLGGIYPALVMSGFQPIRSLAGATSAKGSGTRIPLRAALACAQFAIASALIVTTLAVSLQLGLTREADLGFEPKGLFVVELNSPEARADGQVIVNEFKALPAVDQVAMASRSPMNLGTGFILSSNFTWQRGGQEASAQGFWVDPAFLDTYGMQLLAGRFYDPILDTAAWPIPSTADDGQAPLLRIVINRRLAESLGFESAGAAIGERIHQETQNARARYEIIGVVENSRYLSPRAAPGNEVYLRGAANLTAIVIRYRGSAAEIRGALEAAWRGVMGDAPFRGHFLDEVLSRAFEQEESESRLLTVSAFLAIFIACLGLYGLAAYSARRSVKEVGVRKVLGASSGSVLRLFLWRFSKPVLVANLVAWPLAVWATLQWLQRFPEQIDYLLLAPVCLVAAGLSLSIAWLTVGLTTVKAARARPVRSLRYE